MPTVITADHLAKRYSLGEHQAAYGRASRLRVPANG